MICFGPIQSRRLGKSLGLNNIISPKTCSYDCLYCQVGKTIHKTIKRENFFKPDVICDKTGKYLKMLSTGNRPDYLTFVANGEPTLDKNLGNSIRLLKKYGIPVAVITNASLLFDKEACNDLVLADWISVKVDSASNYLWQIINRPHPDLNFRKHIENIILFSREYKGIICTESMIIDGINDTDENFKGLAAIIKEINPFLSYLSIQTRPPSESFVKTPDTEKLHKAWQIFTGENIRAELLTGFEGTDAGYTGNIYEDILNITAVHPMREDTLMKLLERDNSGFQVVESLLRQKLIRSTIYEGKRFYLREYHRSD